MKDRIKILAPAGSMEALEAALKSGADAVYFGGDMHNARAGAKNFNNEEMATAISLCHAYGAEAHITVNTLVTDREIPEVANFIKFLCENGADAVIVQDLGLATLIKQWAPKLKTIASTQCAFNNSAAVQLAERLGFSTAVVGRELGRSDLASICKDAPIEIEYFAHGAMCFSVSGQCYLSAMLGRRSGNRGQCAGPCRLPYSIGGSKSRYMLSLKDLCLADEVLDLEKIGVGTLKIEGRLKRPEYVSSVTRLYKSIVTNRRRPDVREIESLSAIFSRSGFTDGYYKEDIGRDMFGMRDETVTDKQEKAIAYEREIAKFSETPPKPKSPVKFIFEMKAGKPAKLTAICGDAKASAVGDIPQKAVSRATSLEDLEKAFAKLGDTPFFLEEIEAEMEEALMLPISSLNALRREVTTLLAGIYGGECKIPFAYELPKIAHQAVDKLKVYASFSHFGQIPEDISHLSMVFLPVHEFVRRSDELKELAGKGVALGVVLPKVLWDSEIPSHRPPMEKAKALGATAALIYNLGSLPFAKEYFDTVIGDSGLNVFNAHAASSLKMLGLTATTLSFELSFAQLRDLEKPFPTGITAYGRLPLMISENCLYKNEFGCNGKCKLPTTLTDRQNEKFVVVKDGTSCRNVILNPKTLYLADKKSEYAELGLDYIMLSFTTESVDDAANVIAAYTGTADAKPEAFTRGLYNRGVL